MKKTNESFQPLSPLERQKLMPCCAELHINPNDYPNDEALCQAITEAVLDEVMAEEAAKMDMNSRQ